MRSKLYILLPLVLILTGVCASDGLCQFGRNPYVMILNHKNHPERKSGISFSTLVTSPNIWQMNSVKRITATNTDQNIDDKVYEISLNQYTRNLQVGEYANFGDEFTGQYGTYVVTVEYGDGRLATAETNPLPPDLIPLPVPQNLRVSFEKGSTAPRLSVDPVAPGIDFDVYDFRIFDKDYKRRIYRTIISSSDVPEVTFPENRYLAQTAEELVPGETYIFRVDIMKTIPGSSNILDGQNFIKFKVPSAPTPSCIQPPAGLTGWWPGDEPSDGTSPDIIGGRSAELRGDATTGLGLVGRAFVLDGDGDFVNVPHDPALNFGTGDFTVALWALFNDLTGEQVLAEKYIERLGNGPSEGWTLTKLEDNTLLIVTVSATDDGGSAEAYGPLPIAALTWNHFAATRHAGKLTTFMNGVPVASAVASSVNVDSNSSLKFGHRGHPDDTEGSEDDRGFYLNGRIDEAQIFVGRALPAAHIRAIFEAGSAGMCK